MYKKSNICYTTLFGKSNICYTTLFGKSNICYTTLFGKSNICYTTLFGKSNICRISALHYTNCSTDWFYLAWFCSSIQIFVLQFILSPLFIIELACVLFFHFYYFVVFYYVKTYLFSVPFCFFLARFCLCPQFISSFLFVTLCLSFRSTDVWKLKNV